MKRILFAVGVMAMLVTLAVFAFAVTRDLLTDGVLHGLGAGFATGAVLAALMADGQKVIDLVKALAALRLGKGTNGATP